MQREKTTYVYCDICGTDLDEAQVLTDEQAGIEVAYIRCHECGHRQDFLFDSKATLKWKDKLLTLKEMQKYIQAMIYLEGAKAHDQYYQYRFNQLTNEEKEQVGEYVPLFTKETEEGYRETFKKYKPKLKDMIKLL